MYSLLVVDDEIFAAQGISQGIDWSELGVEQIYVAYNAIEAQSHLKNHKIDIIIADIEMPGWNGLKLLEWMNNENTDSITIFLTAHANFDYAQEAIHLGGFSYLLKPVEHDKLKEEVGKAIEKITRDREMGSFNELYQRYYELWEKQLPVVVERFWQNILSQRTNFNPERIALLMEQYNIPLTITDPIIPILISIEQWKEEFNTRDEEIMEFAIRSAAVDIFCEDLSGDVIQDHKGNLLVFMYPSDDSLEELTVQCKAYAGKYIEACSTYFYCSVSCYIGEPTPISQLSRTYSVITEMERNNIRNANRVITQQEHTDQGFPLQPVPWLPDWIVLFEMGKKEEIMGRLNSLFDGLEQAGDTTPEMLEAIYYGLLYVLYYVFNKNEKNLNTIYNMKHIHPDAVRSVSLLKSWAIRTLTIALENLDGLVKEHSSIVNKVHHYISQHLQDECTREEIAAHVNLNPAYLSRLYKNEMGETLTDYIMKSRMNQARDCLRKSNMKISSIAESVGYYNFSHFSKIFKKAFGVTPQEYRKKYQDVSE